MSVEIDRKPRSASTREKAKRKRGWVNPNEMATPDPRPGKVFRWIRKEFLGQEDRGNMATRVREGWEIVPPSEVPEMGDFITRNGEYVEYGGLVLAWMDEEIVKEREAYYQRLTDQQLSSVDRAMVQAAQPHRSMPLLDPERETHESDNPYR